MNISSVLQKFLAIIQTVGGVVISLVAPQLSPIIHDIIVGITAAEQIAGATGPQKLASVQQIASDAADAVNTAHGTPIIDKTALAATVASAVGTVISATNVVIKPATPAA